MMFDHRMGLVRVLLSLFLCSTFACAVDTDVVSLNADTDSLQFSIPSDSIQQTVDTLVVDGDTVVVVVVDTVVTPADTVVVVVVDTVVTPADTVVVVVVDTVVRTVTDTVIDQISGDTVISVVTDTVVRTIQDTVVVLDTVVQTTQDTVVLLDTVVQTIVDTVIALDTVLVVDTVFALPSFDFGVEALQVQVGQSKTITVSATNALGFPVPAENIGWFSTDPQIASVTATGTVTGRAPGDVDVVAVSTAEGISASLPVEVYPDSSLIPESGHPNEPAGMTPIYSNIGLTSDLASQGWDTQQGPDPTHWATRVSVVTDGTNPAGSGSALEFYHPGEVNYGSFAGKAIVTDFSKIDGSLLTSASEIYIHSWVYMPQDLLIHGQKLWYIGMENSGSNKLFLTWETNGVMRVQLQGMGEGSWSYGIYPAPLEGLSEQWVRIEMYARAASSRTAADGEISVWVNGVLVSRRIDRPTADPAGIAGPLLEGFEWYHNADAGPGLPAHSYRVGEIYISGRG